MNSKTSSFAFATAIALALPLLGCPPDKRPPCDPSALAPGPQRLCNPHSVILVRHAEKAPVAQEETNPDPELSAKGNARAARLATLLGKTAVTRLVATEYKRTQQTLVPLSERVSKPVEIRSAKQTNELIRELRAEPPGSTTVVATHSNVLPLIVQELGGAPLRALGPYGTLTDDDYARVIVMSVGCSTTASVVELSSD